MDVHLTDLQSKKRGRHVVYARQVAMYLARELTPLSFPTIARKFGGRDHTTVIHAHKRITASCSRADHSLACGFPGPAAWGQAAP